MRIVKCRQAKEVQFPTEGFTIIHLRKPNDFAYYQYLLSHLSSTVSYHQICVHTVDTQPSKS